jgi:hypothetical protein
MPTRDSAGSVSLALRCGAWRTVVHNQTSAAHEIGRIKRPVVEIEQSCPAAVEMSGIDPQETLELALFIVAALRLGKRFRDLAGAFDEALRYGTQSAISKSHDHYRI